MKKFINIKLGILTILGLMCTQCEDPLKTEVYGEYSLVDGPASKGFMDGLLNGVYAEFQFNGVQGRDFFYFSDFSGDHLYNERGGLSRVTAFVQNWNWDAQNPSWFRDDFWTKPYAAIRNANFFLEVVDNSELSAEEKNQYKAEVRFARATTYAFMYNWFGSVPLRTSSSDPADMERASDDEMREFIETELADAAKDLPVTAEEFGRATQGAAYGILMKHYLNTKNWDKVVEYANLIQDLGVYSLYTAGSNPYRDLFKVSTEGSENETIYSFPATSLIESTANAIMSHSYPESNYKALVNGDDVKLSNQSISGTKNRAYDFFLNSFEPNDDRKKQIINQYINSEDEVVTQAPDKNAVFKYWPDPNMLEWKSGHDFRIIRYADVLLSKAEALNEINGPTQEVIDLINEVRGRAKASVLELADYPSTEGLRDAILEERGWEFYFEGKRREDLIRHGKFVSAKKNHPIHPVPSAEDFRVLMPIPQEEIDVNPNMVQNPGY
ncbi:RagB/SusD family nutrient uptake outer membrane protein [Zobellia galactanivorans]|uniref:RagB/SusD family nutrient uptake outer membrane protein n=1 Tax=Zobellia galactanivorans (strain DSM 12802 / CCUG 47099 / CIP 106680 / NCIMB 13871 / Dsij) TaxID=63186 RepID=UPI001C079860|nr:RagB/SusD family nutrient uptake outer membrane protein [Zobellia galactanivorans]MBU3028397.1 RagB/SusD family nutrient uptake outer membrane protein [Zobellia galactanivorans]